MAGVKFHFAAAVAIVILIGASFQASEFEEYCEEDGECWQTRSALGDKLKALLEAFRSNMTQPMPDMGLPVLDPFQLAVLPVNLSFNGLSAIGELEDLHIEGLSTFVIDRIDFSFIGLTITFRLFLAKVSVSTKCNVSISDTLHLSGDNTLSLEGDDLTLSGSISLAGRGPNNNLYLTKVTLDFSYGTINVNLGDISSDARLTKALQSLVNDLLPQILDREKTNLMNWAQQQVMTFGDHLLQNTTAVDIIHSING